jgi:hypothetical protein
MEGMMLFWLSIGGVAVIGGAVWVLRELTRGDRLDSPEDCAAREAMLDSIEARHWRRLREDLGL